MNILLLGSSSLSRQTLLRDIQIPFLVIGHTANEDDIPHTDSLTDTVLTIARYKMNHIVIPSTYTELTAYILTADTMLNHKGVIHGKPANRHDAETKLQALRTGPMITATGFCIEKRIFQNNQWITIESHNEVVTAESVFNVPDTWTNRYLEYSLGMVASGAVAIELYGGQFLQSINGSYSAMVGLPQYEVRIALEKYGFFD